MTRTSKPPPPAGPDALVPCDQGPRRRRPSPGTDVAMTAPLNKLCHQRETMKKRGEHERKGRSLWESIISHMPPRNAKGCREWTGQLSRKGNARLHHRTGTFRVADIVLSHKLGRPLHPKMQAYHTCNNPPCVEAQHLYEGPISGNRRKRRHDVDYSNMARGERSSLSKLTEEGVLYIRAKRKQGVSLKKLARQFRVSDQCISMAARGVSWKHVK